MTAPDLSKKSAQLRFAAAVMREFNTDHPEQYTEDGWWRPSDLEREAEHVEAEEREEAALQLQAQELAYRIQHLTGVPMGVGQSAANLLIDEGWRREGA